MPSSELICLSIHFYSLAHLPVRYSATIHLPVMPPLVIFRADRVNSRTFMPVPTMFADTSHITLEPRQTQFIADMRTLGVNQTHCAYAIALMKQYAVIHEDCQAVHVLESHLPNRVTGDMFFRLACCHDDAPVGNFTESDDEDLNQEVARLRSSLVIVEQLERFCDALDFERNRQRYYWRNAVEPYYSGVA
ncbi:unnamed protein product [Penicillium bialowiezense]